MRIIICIFAPAFLFTSIFAQRRRPVFTCGGNFTGDTGLIGSQGYPGVYPPNNKCVWRITVPQGRVVSLLFQVLDLESDHLCRYDYVDIYDGHINGQRLGRFCGTARPGRLVTNGNKMQVVMVSEANTAGSGFLAAYSAIRPNERGDRYCGGHLDKPVGTIKTPNWPDRDYPLGVTCLWHIVAPQDQIIELKFEKFDVERDSYCRYDQVAVFNGGEMNESQKIGKFCGDSPPVPVYSDGDHLLVMFISDLSLTADGFIGHYQFKQRTLSTVSAPLTPASTSPPTTRPMALTYSEDLCKQKCKRTGTIESHYCMSNFVITATLISAAMRDQSILATFSIMHLYKEGSLAIQQAGKTMSTKVTVLCKNCPLVRRGLNYIVMGQTNDQGHGVISPLNFVMAFKAKKQRDLGVLKNIRC
ncbi:procollagen C-endopeptidase enhancer 2 [Triplophysa rosa]|uniref:Procollagen C-endopeptidase enhancer 2 n=1 Tax=Triplophysa rosa TaxID=992332 RepID=A0A9W7WV94_TRIRA|nr:procollagen C-endopeptidase enhancer 2 [Triplophysa rosa]KAI7809265.1 putative procollagen C-endopeptidase enhancer 2 [Triplophysa rosa]